MRLLAAALTGIGCGFVTAGAWMWETPAGVVAAGVSLIAAGIQLAREIETTP